MGLDVPSDERMGLDDRRMGLDAPSLSKRGASSDGRMGLDASSDGRMEWA